MSIFNMLRRRGSIARLALGLGGAIVSTAAMAHTVAEPWYVGTWDCQGPGGLSVRVVWDIRSEAHQHCDGDLCASSYRTAFDGRVITANGQRPLTARRADEGSLAFQSLEPGGWRAGFSFSRRAGDQMEGTLWVPARGPYAPWQSPLFCQMVGGSPGW